MPNQFQHTLFLYGMIYYLGLIMLFNEELYKINVFGWLNLLVMNKKCKPRDGRSIAIRYLATYKNYDKNVV